jgi:hypothetical protein
MEAVLPADGALVAEVADLPADGVLAAAVADTVADLPVDGALAEAAAAVLRADGAHKAEVVDLQADGVPAEPEVHPAMGKAAGSEQSTSWLVPSVTSSPDSSTVFRSSLQKFLRLLVFFTYFL